MELRQYRVLLALGLTLISVQRLQAGRASHSRGLTAREHTLMLEAMASLQHTLQTATYSNKTERHQKFTQQSEDFSQKLSFERLSQLSKSVVHQTFHTSPWTRLYELVTTPPSNTLKLLLFLEDYWLQHRSKLLSTQQQHKYAHDLQRLADKLLTMPPQLRQQLQNMQQSLPRVIRQLYGSSQLCLRNLKEFYYLTDLHLQPRITTIANVTSSDTFGIADGVDGRALWQVQLQPQPHAAAADFLILQNLHTKRKLLMSLNGTMTSSAGTTSSTMTMTLTRAQTFENQLSQTNDWQLQLISNSLDQFIIINTKLQMKLCLWNGSILLYGPSDLRPNCLWTWRNCSGYQKLPSSSQMTSSS